MSDQVYDGITYLSTIFKNTEILRRFILHLDKTLPASAKVIIYCHDEKTFAESKLLERSYVKFIKGSEDVFFTKAANVLIQTALNDEKCLQLCVLDSDCFISDNFHAMNIKYIGKAGVFKNIELETSKALPAAFRIENKIFGIAKNLELIPYEKNIDSVDYCNGRGLFFPASVVAEIGLWNDRFPLYGSDNEFSVRLSKKLKLHYVREAVVFSNSYETGENVLVKKLSRLSRFKSLWSIRSSSNLRTRILFCWYAAPNKILFFTWAIRSVVTAILINLSGDLLRPLTNFRKK
ncbi:hypothetical protein N9E67_00815 [Amylibacter sp.]|nr:hypothetical protein [Amylibacter sp.]MDC3304289.1 hypothetical protein [Amylibacter sp.]